MVLVEELLRKRTGEIEVYEHKLIKNTDEEYWCPDLDMKVNIKTGWTSKEGVELNKPFDSSRIRTITYRIKE